MVWYCAVTTVNSIQNFSVTAESHPVSTKPPLLISLAPPPHPALNPPLPATRLHSVCMNVPIPDISFQWNPVKRDICVWLLSLHVMFSRSPTLEQVSELHSFAPWLVCLLMDISVVSVFGLWWIGLPRGVIWVQVFSSLGSISKSGPLWNLKVLYVPGNTVYELYIYKK